MALAEMRNLIGRTESPLQDQASSTFQITRRITLFASSPSRAQIGWSVHWPDSPGKSASSTAWVQAPDSTTPPASRLTARETSLLPTRTATQFERLLRPE